VCIKVVYTIYRVRVESKKGQKKEKRNVSENSNIKEKSWTYYINTRPSWRAKAPTSTGEKTVYRDEGTMERETHTKKGTSRAKGADWDAIIRQNRNWPIEADEKAERRLGVYNPRKEESGEDSRRELGKSR